MHYQTRPSTRSSVLLVCTCLNNRKYVFSAPRVKSKILGGQKFGICPTHRSTDRVSFAYSVSQSGVVPFVSLDVQIGEGGRGATHNSRLAVSLTSPKIWHRKEDTRDVPFIFVHFWTDSWAKFEGKYSALQESARVSGSQNMPFRVLITAGRVT